jgi:hypothetical protein
MQYVVRECHNEMCGDKCVIRTREEYTPKGLYESSNEDCIVFKDLYAPIWVELYSEDV